MFCNTFVTFYNMFLICLLCMTVGNCYLVTVYWSVGYHKTDRYAVLVVFVSGVCVWGVLLI